MAVSSSAAVRLLSAVAVGVLAVPVAASAQDWGVVKKTVTLKRSLPPVINLSGARVSVKVAGAGGPATRSAAITQQLQAKVVPLLFSDKTLIESSDNPDRVIEITLTDFNAAVTTDVKDKTQVASGVIKAGYRTINNRTKESLDARNLSVQYEKRYPPAAVAGKPRARTGILGVVDKGLSTVRDASHLSQSVGGEGVMEAPPTVAELTTRMVDALAVQVAQRIVLTEEILEVPLPRGAAFDKISDLGKATPARWGAMLERLEQMKPLAGDDDAFRLYGIGVANEAMAYSENDPGSQRDLIASASQQYKDALKLRANDGILRAAEDRIAGSLAALDVAATMSRGSKGPAAAKAAPAKKAEESRWDNAAVIELLKGGFKDAELVEAIKTAPNPAFALDSPKDLLQLRQGGISDVVVRAMRQRMAAAAKP